MSDNRPTSGPAPGYGEYGPRPDPPAVPAPAAAPAAAESAPAKRAPRDFPITVGLLVVGVLFAVQSVASAARFPDAVRQAFVQMGVADYQATSADAVGGPVIAVAAVAALLIAVWGTVLLRRAGRRTFWVPLVAGTVVLLVNLVVVTVVILVNPAMAELVTLRTS